MAGRISDGIERVQVSVTVSVKQNEILNEMYEASEHETFSSFMRQLIADATPYDYEGEKLQAAVNIAIANSVRDAERKLEEEAKARDKIEADAKKALIASMSLSELQALIASTKVGELVTN